MIRDFKLSLFENTPSKNLHHTETSQRTPPTNQKPAEILEINNSFNISNCNCIENESNQHKKNECIPKTNHSPDCFSQAHSDRCNLLLNKAI